MSEFYHAPTELGMSRKVKPENKGKKIFAIPSKKTKFFIID